MKEGLNISNTFIENRIFTIQNSQVMVDRDLAEMYQVPTKVLNQAVKRNIERFPLEFRFQLSDDENNELVTNYDRFKNLKSQSVTSSKNSLRSQSVTLKNNRGKHSKYLPYVFTEQGVAMLSAVLRSDIAIQVSIQIINAFVQMRKSLIANAGILQRLDKIEEKQITTNQTFEKVFKALEQKNTIPTQGIFFDNQVFDAYTLIADIVRTAKASIILIDNYIDDTTLTHLCKKETNIKVTLLTKTISKQLQLDVKKANIQYPTVVVKQFTKAHDRFLIIDQKEIYHIGASLKDLGKKWFAFTKLNANSVTILKTIHAAIKN